MHSRKISLLCLGVALMWAFASPVQKAHAQSTLTPWQKLTQSQLTAVWWQWLLSIPVSASPVVDNSGAHAYSAQPYQDLVFLAGTFILTPGPDGDQVGNATRNITVKPGTALFVPVLNNEGDNVCFRPHLGGNCFEQSDFPEGTVIGVTKLRALAAMSMDSARELHATLTTLPHGGSVTLPPARLQSPVFSFNLPATDNLYQASGVHVSGRVAPAIADGFWVFISALPRGSYLLEFGGKADIIDPFTLTVTGTFTLGITYNITVE